MLLMSEVLWMSEGQRRHCNDEHNICYQFNYTAKTHTDADDFCRSHNGQLATIFDSKTQQFIAHLVGREHSYYWIGGKLNVLQRWTWVDDGQYPG